MVVHTKDPQSTLARKQMLEFTLVNHPIDCPICDKAGECTLQKLYFDHDNADSRVDTPKVQKDKVVDLGPHIVLDQERCILCTRCIRVCDEVAGEHQLEMSNRGDHEVLGTAPGAKLDNPYSLNTVDVCPVGALTSKDFRFTMRAWELEATPTICQGCSTGCNIELHHKNERAWRIVPRHNPDVNQYWMCDEGRFGYHELREARLAVATVNGLPAGWERALKSAADRLAPVLKQAGSLGVVLSATQTNEDNFALASLAKAWGAGRIFLGAHPTQPSRADGRLRTDDINPNRAGALAIAKGLGLAVGTAADLEEAVRAGAIHALVVLGETLDVSPEILARIGELEVIAISSHERGVVKQAKVALPAAAWAEVAGTVTNGKGMVQRMHAAFSPPGQAIPAWEVIVKLANVTGVKLAWTHPREVFKDMTAKVVELAGAQWVREARPLQLRFAGSRG